MSVALQGKTSHESWYPFFVTLYTKQNAQRVVENRVLYQSCIVCNTLIDRVEKGFSGGDSACSKSCVEFVEFLRKMLLYSRKQAPYLPLSQIVSPCPARIPLDQKLSESRPVKEDFTFYVRLHVEGDIFLDRQTEVSRRSITSERFSEDYRQLIREICVLCGKEIVRGAGKFSEMKTDPQKFRASIASESAQTCAGKCSDIFMTLTTSPLLAMHPVVSELLFPDLDANKTA